jgi:hypothetical protein
VYRDLERENAEEKGLPQKASNGVAPSLFSSPLIVTGHTAYYPCSAADAPANGENGAVGSPTAHMPPPGFPVAMGVSDAAQSSGKPPEPARQPDLYMDLAALNSMDSKYWRGIRVRVGIHYGQGEIKHDPVTLGYDYYGTVVNTAARVEGVGNGGQVLLTEAAYEAALKDDAFKEIEASVTEVGPQPLRGLDQPIPLYQVVPTALKGREFPPLRLDIEHDASDSEIEHEEDSSEGSIASGDMTPEMMAQKMARRWHSGNTGGYGQALSNLMLMFNFQKHLYAPSNEKGRKGAVEHLATKWRVHLRKSKKLSSKALWEYQLMQLLLKVYPGFEKKEKGVNLAARLRGRGDSTFFGSSHEEASLGVAGTSDEGDRHLLPAFVKQALPSDARPQLAVSNNSDLSCMDLTGLVPSYAPSSLQENSLSSQLTASQPD